MLFRALKVVLGSAVLLSQLLSSQLLSSQLLLSQVSHAQPAPATRNLPAGLEFPVIMRQTVAAGKTPVGTKVQAKLVVATMVSGGVIPQGAILPGDVTESVAKSATDPSRLAIRMDSAQWTNGSAPIKVYLTAWYYPAATPADQDLSSGLPDAGNNPRPRMGGVYPGQRNPTSPPFSGSDTGSSPAPDISKHRILMKNVESTPASDGAVTLTSKRFNIKLDKETTYVMAAGDLAHGPG